MSSFRRKIRSTSIIALLIFTLASLQAPAYSAGQPKVGTKCAKAGLKKSLGSKNFLCARSKKRLVWTLAKEASQAAPTVTPDTSQSAAPSSTSTPLPAPILTIMDLPLQFKYIKYWAWSKTWAEIGANPENSSTIEVLVGPSTKVCHLEQTLNAIRLLQRVYADVRVPKKLWLLYVDLEVDRTWVENKTASLLPPDRIQYDSSKRMAAIETVNTDGEGVLWAVNSCSAVSGLIFSSQTVHEYTHVIQDLQYSADPNDYGRWGEVPRWLIEGAASWSQVFYEQKDDIKRFEKSGEWRVLSSYDNNFFHDYLIIPEYSTNLWIYTDQWPGKRAYDLGSYVCDMLVALRGPASIVALNSEYLSTGSFERSFSNIFGMPWAQAQPYLSEAAELLIKWLADPANRA